MGSTLYILLPTTLKSLANITMTNSKPFFALVLVFLLNWIVHLVGIGKIGYSSIVCCRYVWESKADGSFAISEDTWNEPLGRGTEIRLHLRDEAGEYLEESKLKVSIFNTFNQ